ncbi:unnamed protein product [Bemisia tabaci]|uniref:RNA-directed RNA polymerase C-terminal domain-containing protein n=1 Tax=Bemisia tabaci TaxID=7038 RepID=A0A9P0AEY7_BEMTA|nr:unnamed protein product [Bemisia tabaci]
MSSVAPGRHYSTTISIPTRYSLVGSFESPKIRHVWGTAFENILLEGITAAPLISRYAELSEPMVIGVNMCKGLPNIIHKVLDGTGSPQYGVGLDIKSFDSSLQPWLMNAALDILEDNIDFTGYYGWLSFQFSQKFFLRLLASTVAHECRV